MLGKLQVFSDIFKGLTRILGPEVGSSPSRKNLLERLRSRKMRFSRQHCGKEFLALTCTKFRRYEILS